jgi:hydroxymethylbilane synthase
MEPLKAIIIGSRGSDLALCQSEFISKKLQSLAPTILVDIQIITTKGDINKDPIPLTEVGKGWFTKEIEQALLEGTIDVAVHSLKDLPEQLPEGLYIGAIPEREDPRDVLITREGQQLQALKKGAIIGTDSLRRKVQILEMRSDLVVESIRGNVPTRLKKLHTESYDAVVLAAAGLHRLGLQDRITHYFEPEEMTPAPGQGALAIELRTNDTALGTIVAAMNDPLTELTSKAERAFSQAIGGGCKQPIGVYAMCEQDRVTIQAMAAPQDCSRIVRDSISGSCTECVSLGQELAARMLRTLN